MHQAGLAVLAGVTLVTPAFAAVNIDYVTVGNAGNAADAAVMRTDGTTGYGAVSYEYKIGKYEVTNAQYGAYLNEAAKTDTYSLYPNGQNTITTADANYNYSVGSSTDVGSYSGDASAYGTFDQGGNVWEWNDAVISGLRGLRGALGTTSTCPSCGHPTAPASPRPTSSPVSLNRLQSSYRSQVTKVPFYNLSKFTIGAPAKGSGLNGLLDDPNQLAPNLNSYINGNHKLGVHLSAPEIKAVIGDTPSANAMKPPKSAPTATASPNPTPTSAIPKPSHSRKALKPTSNAKSCPTCRMRGSTPPRPRSATKSRSTATSTATNRRARWKSSKPTSNASKRIFRKCSRRSRRENGFSAIQNGFGTNAMH